MKSNAEIKQHKGLDVVRYSEIAGTKGLAGERDVGHTRQIVKPASQPAPRPSYNPPWMVRVVCRQEDCRGEVQRWLAAQCWSGLCDFNKKTSVEKEPAASEMRVFLFLRSIKKMFVPWLRFLDRALWPVAQGISHYEDSLPDWQPMGITPLSSLLTPWHETDLNVTKIIRGMHSQDFLVPSVYLYFFLT